MQYPYVHSVKKISKPKGMCKICGNPKSDRRVDVAVNHFRGDDDVYTVHNDCLYNIGKKMFVERIK